MNVSPDSLLGWILRLNGFSSHYVNIGSCKIHHFEKRAQNEKGVLVFVHGIGASAGHFAQVLPQLHKEGYSLFALDLPSHGWSSDPDECVTSDVFYALFSNWMNQVLPGSFVLVGNSLGGAISLRYALENQNRVEKLILISPAGGFESQGEWERFKVGLKFNSIEDSKKFVPKIYHNPPFYMPIIYKPFLRNMQRRGLKELIEHTHFETFNVDSKQLPHLPPTLFIWGKSEKLFPETHLRRFKKELPSQVRFEEPGKIGHCPQLDSPTWLAKRIQEFRESS